MYGRAVEKFADEALKEVPEGELERIANEMGIIGSRLNHLPFCQLRGRKFDRPGVLRLWVKYKSLKKAWGDNGEEIQPTWEDLRWRPLVSFQHYRWKKLLSMVSRW